MSVCVCAYVCVCVCVCPIDYKLGRVVVRDTRDDGDESLGVREDVFLVRAADGAGEKHPSACMRERERERERERKRDIWSSIDG